MINDYEGKNKQCSHWLITRGIYNQAFRGANLTNIKKKKKKKKKLLMELFIHLFKTNALLYGRLYLLQL